MMFRKLFSKVNESWMGLKCGGVRDFGRFPCFLFRALDACRYPPGPPGGRELGRIRRFDRSKGFGFLECANGGPDVFFLPSGLPKDALMLACALSQKGHDGRTCSEELNTKKSNYILPPLCRWAF